MTRDEAIEAGARALRNSMFPLLDVDDTHPVAAGWRATAAAVLDAIGWVEPVGYVIAYDDRTPPSMVFQGVTDLPAAREWADPGERVWGLVPVEVPE